MGLLSDKLSWANLLSGGITGINDDLLKATGARENSTLYAVNDAMKHGPLETSLEQGKPASTGQLWKDRNERLGKDETGNARTIGDIAGLVGMMFGGAALAGGGAAGGAAAGGASAGGGAAAGGSAAAGGGAAAGGAAAGGTAGGASAGSGGFMGGVKSMGQAAGAAQSVQGLLSPQQQAVQASPVTIGNGAAMGSVYAQIEQAELQRQQAEMQQRQQRRQGLLGYGG